MRHPRSAVGLLTIASILALATGAIADEDAKPGPWLGVKISGSDPSGEGVRLARIFNDSAADKAGLRASDVLLTFDGTPVNGSSDLIRQIKAHEPGSWLPVTVRRGDDTLDLRVKLDERPASIRPGDFRRGWIGIDAMAIPPALREHFGAPPDSGIMVSGIREASPAEVAGFELGDVVYEVDEKPVKSVGALREMVSSSGVGNDVEFTVARAGTILVLEARLEAAPVPTAKKR